MNFYRVCNTKTEQGLWYDFKGQFTGLIHSEFDFCKNRELPMEFDEELVGWLSATTSLDHLYEWFPKEDIYKLQEHGWFIHVYEVDNTPENVKFYEKFQHQVINQKTARLVEVIILECVVLPLRCEHITVDVVVS